jgi:hypothetical protein
MLLRVVEFLIIRPGPTPADPAGYELSLRGRWQTAREMLNRVEAGDESHLRENISLKEQCRLFARAEKEDVNLYP